MKTQPDETAITLWIDGELEGEELRQVELWVEEHPELLVERDAIRAMGETFRAHIPSSEEPPYPEFFNKRILRTIEKEQEGEKENSSKTSKISKGVWQWMAMPLAAAAMVVVGFFLGSHTSNDHGVKTQPGLVKSEGETSLGVANVYVPDENVHVDIFDSSSVQATVIVLKGLDSIPDDMEMVGAPYSPSKGMMVHSKKLKKSEESEYTY